MRTHLAPDEIPADAAAKLIPVAVLIRNGRWSHPEGFIAREVGPFRKKVTERTGQENLVIEAYLSTDETQVILLARPHGAPEIE